jgi:Na+/proline symporter
MKHLQIDSTKKRREVGLANSGWAGFGFAVLPLLISGLVAFLQHGHTVTLADVIGVLVTAATALSLTPSP